MADPRTAPTAPIRRAVKHAPPPYAQVRIEEVEVDFTDEQLAKLAAVVFAPVQNRQGVA